MGKSYRARPKVETSHATSSFEKTKMPVRKRANPFRLSYVVGLSSVLGPATRSSKNG